MSNLSTKERNALPDSAFCGPNRTYPILDAEDVKSAARLIGHAAPSAQGDIKACIMRKAKARGWPIPDAWKAGGGGGA